VPFELRSSEGSDAPQEVGALEAIKVKILIHVRDAPTNTNACGKGVLSVAVVVRPLAGHGTAAAF